MKNTVKMYRGSVPIKSAFEYTPICKVDDIVFVDKDAPAGGNGRSWQTAYIELRDALYAVSIGQHDTASQIWVAAGTYCPTDANDPSPADKTFQMLDGIDLYGGFEGWETSLCERDLTDANNATILSGDIDGNGNGDVIHVVTAANCRIDGFTVTKSCSCYSFDSMAGIYCGSDTKDINTTIANCIIKDSCHGIECVTCSSDLYIWLVNCKIENNRYGIYSHETLNSYNCTGEVYLDVVRCTISSNGSGLEISVPTTDVVVRDSNIYDNTSYGIRNSGDGDLTVESCTVSGNGDAGIHCMAFYCWPPCNQLTVKNCNINNNAGGSSEGGIYSYASQSTITNNIICNNMSMGVKIDYGSADITGNIIYGNSDSGICLTNSSSPQIRNNTIAFNQYGISNSSASVNLSNCIIWGNTDGGFTGTTVTANYCCLQADYTGGGTDNIVGQDPQFRDELSNDYHLTDSSPCIDTGNPSFTPPDANETDIDGEARKIDGDSNGSAIVDMGADEYYCSPVDLFPNPNPDGVVNFSDYAVFANNGVIDFEDLAVFCEDWLWTAGWLLNNYDRGIGGEGASFEGAGCPDGGEGMMMSEDFSAEQLDMSLSSIPTVETVFDINEILDWLDEIWQSGDLADSMTKKEYLEFRESIENYEK